MEALVKSCNICWIWSGMLGHSQHSKITKHQYLWEWWKYFVYLLHVVADPRKLQRYHVVLVGYGPACLKFSEISLERVGRLSDFVDFLDVVICILSDIC